MTPGRAHLSNDPVEQCLGFLGTGQARPGSGPHVDGKFRGTKVSLHQSIRAKRLSTAGCARTVPTLRDVVPLLPVSVRPPDGEATASDAPFPRNPFTGRGKPFRLFNFYEVCTVPAVDSGR